MQINMKIYGRKGLANELGVVLMTVNRWIGEQRLIPDAIVDNKMLWLEETVNGYKKEVEIYKRPSEKDEKGNPKKIVKKQKILA